MAVNLIANPVSPIEAYSPIVFELSIDDIGDGVTEIRKLAYQLKTAGGDDITPVEAVRPPVAGVSVFIDIARDVQGLVKTIIPEVPSGQTAYNANYMFVEVILHYGEIVTDLENCTSTTTLSNQSDRIRIFNTALQAYEPPLSAGSPRFLVHQPAATWQIRDAVNYLATMGAVAGTITTSSGTSIPASAPFDANLIPFGLHGFDLVDEDTVAWLKYTGGDREYKIYFRDTCKRGAEFCNIMFLDPLGGRNCISFENITAMGMTTSFDTYKRVNPYTFPQVSGQLNSREVRGNDTIHNKVNRERITLVRDAPDDSDHREWFKAFLGSVGYHIQRYDSAGNITWQKFILESGSIDYLGEDTIDFQVSGYCVPLYNTQRSDL